MNNEKKLQAKNLFFQTSLSKTQIAEVLSISRRSLHYWVKEGNWERLRRCSENLPSLIAENCYYVMGHLTNNILSESRILRPATHLEADTLHKLTLTINKLKNRTTVNESMEMFGYFMEMVNKKSPDLANQVMPIVEEYMSSRAGVFMTSLMPDKFTPQGFIPHQEKDPIEEKLDMQDIFEWDLENNPPLVPEQPGSSAPVPSVTANNPEEKEERKTAVQQHRSAPLPPVTGNDTKKEEEIASQQLSQASKPLSDEERAAFYKLMDEIYGPADKEETSRRKLMEDAAKRYNKEHPDSKAA